MVHWIFAVGSEQTGLDGLLDYRASHYLTTGLHTTGQLLIINLPKLTSTLKSSLLDKIKHIEETWSFAFIIACTEGSCMTSRVTNTWHLYRSKVEISCSSRVVPPGGYTHGNTHLKFMQLQCVSHYSACYHQYSLKEQESLMLSTDLA